MNRTVSKLFKEANYSAFENLELELDAREMKFFLSEHYITTQIVLSEEEFYSLRVAQEYCINNKDRNLLKYTKICPATVQYLKCWLGEEVNFLSYTYFWEYNGVEGEEKKIF